MRLMFLPSRCVVKVVTIVDVGSAAVDVVVIHAVMEQMVMVVVVVMKVIIVHLPERIRLS